MSQPEQVTLLLEVQRLARKYGRAALLEAAEALESAESRGELVNAFRAIAHLTPRRQATRTGRERAIGVKREVLEDPQRSVEA